MGPIFLVISATLCVAAYFLYVRALLRSGTTPNRWSWLIWSSANLIEVLTFQGISGDYLTTAVFGVSAAMCVATMALIWSGGKWTTPSLTEFVSVAATLGAVWAFVHFNAWWAHLVMLVAIPVSFAPTYRSAWIDGRREDSASWMLWTLGDVSALAFVLTRLQSWQEIPYAVIEAASHAGVWLIVLHRAGDAPTRLARATSSLIFGVAYSVRMLVGAPLLWLGLSSLGRPETALSALLGAAALTTSRPNVRQGQMATLPEMSAPIAALGENHLGKAVYAGRPIAAGEWIMDFVGPVIRLSSPESRDDLDRLMQIGPDEYLGPSGMLDDFVNHSCEPNAGLRFKGRSIFMFALRDIAKGEEIAWDYSTTAHAAQWTMQCACRADTCRGVVGQFADVPELLRRRYMELGIVAPYLTAEPSLPPATA